MKKIKPLSYSHLYTPCDPKSFNFNNTNDLKELNQIVGQERALDSLQFGIGIEHHGFNLYVQGPSGIGKHAILEQVLRKYVLKKPCQDDWCYVYNFEEPTRPASLRIPHGYAKQFKEDMESFIEDIRNSIPAVFESDEYRLAIQNIEKKIKVEQESQFLKLQKEAHAHKMTILSTPHGFTVAPTEKGKIQTQEELDELTKKQQKQQKQKLDLIKNKLVDLLALVPKWQKITREQKKIIQKESTKTVVNYLLKDLLKKYKAFDSIVKYLRSVKADIIDHVSLYAENNELKSVSDLAVEESRYQINILVASDSESIPVIYEDNPTYPNLIGRVEQKAHMGILITDFTLIRPGALHRANGGYLLVDANKILMQPYAWATLKQALYGHEIRIEPMGEKIGMITTVTLEPEPIPLNVKVIMIGDRTTYYLLSALDPDFEELFKVEVDFNEEFIRNKSNNRLYSNLLANLIKKAKLNPFDKGAIARVIEYSSRIMNDAQRLSLHLRRLDDLLREADYWSKSDYKKIVTKEYVETAISKKIYRSSRLRNKLYEDIERGNVLISTKNSVIGQINALSILAIGDEQFGMPVRITATARVGRGEIINIEKEVNLSGDIHSKSVFILSGFLYNRFAKDQALSLLATLVFEQCYSLIDGDSASVPELCALLSAIGNFPIKQMLAVTGSINQMGEVQAVGGVNDKIEGFFHICQFFGLTGEQGVVIPAANVKHLMLSKEIRQAVKAKKFNVYAIDTIDEAMEIFTDLKPGKKNKKGRYTPGSFNAVVEKRLQEFSKQHEHQHHSDESKEEEDSE